MGDSVSRPAPTSSDRPPRWLLDLGLDVDTGHRPWLPMLAAGLGMAAAPWLVGRITAEAPESSGRDAQPPPWLDTAVDTLQTVMLVVAAATVMFAIAYWAVGRYARSAWRALPEAEQKAIRQERIEQLTAVLERLGGQVTGLPIASEDLEDLSPRHREVIEDLRARADQTDTPLCAGGRARALDLVMAGRLYRALSKDTITRPPHGAATATDPRVTALTDLDRELDGAAASLGESITSGRCNCAHEDHDRLVQAGNRVHALLHGHPAGDPTDDGPVRRPIPRWVPIAAWTGAAVAFAALPIGLLTPVPTVVVSALGMTLAAGAVLGRRPTGPRDRFQRRLVLAAWLVIVLAAAVTVLA